MAKFILYNQSSESIGEVNDKSVDLIIAGPPYNIGTKYGNNGDLNLYEDYVSLLKNIFSECERVLKEGGVMVIEAADTVLMSGRYVLLSALIQNICLGVGLNLWQRHINFSKSDEGIELMEHDWDNDFSTKNNAHSNNHQWLVFKKGEASFQKTGEIFYINYPIDEDGHPCPFSQEHIDTFLKLYFKEGMTVLDPFMGTGRLGEGVIKRGGNFIGVEQEKIYYETAKRRLENL